MKKLFLSTLLLALPLLTNAFVGDAEVDGLWYNINTEDKVATVIRYKSNYYSGDITIPSTITYEKEECNVISIGNYAFSKCSSLTSITIPNSVSSIEDRAFNNCTSLSSVDIPNSVTSIGDHAFYGCSSLTSITIGNSVTRIGIYAFYGCSDLTSVHITDLDAWCKIVFSDNSLSQAYKLYLNGKEVKDLVIPNSVTNLGERTFEGCTSLTSVTIPNSVTTIGICAFSDCNSLTSVTIGNSVTNIGGSAFSGCNNLVSLTIGNSVSYIGESAFDECSSLTSVTIPNSVTNIGRAAFRKCYSLTSVTIPNSVSVIENDAFYNCSSLTSVTIPNSVTTIGYQAFYACNSLTSVTIPNSVNSIGDKSFQYCSSLISVTIGNSVTFIGTEAFRGCGNLTSVIIGCSIEKIGELAFANCNNLEEVYCYAVIVPSTYFSFSYPYPQTLYVPASALNAYKEDREPWNKFGTIKAISGTGGVPQKCSTPIISYANKKLMFSSNTEGVEYYYSIIDKDIKSAVASSIDLSATYEISVYAMKSGFENSDVATATLVWTDAVFTETTPSTSSAKAIAESIPVLISAKNGTITVRGEQNGLPLTVYTADGKMLGSATMKDGQASISTNLQRGEIAIVKVGSKSMKIVM